MDLKQTNTTVLAQFPPNVHNAGSQTKGGQREGGGAILDSYAVAKSMPLLIFSCQHGEARDGMHLRKSGKCRLVGLKVFVHETAISMNMSATLRMAQLLASYARVCIR